MEWVTRSAGPQVSFWLVWCSFVKLDTVAWINGVIQEPKGRFGQLGGGKSFKRRKKIKEQFWGRSRTLCFLLPAQLYRHVSFSKADLKNSTRGFSTILQMIHCQCSLLYKRRGLNYSPKEKRQERETLREGGEWQDFYPGSASHREGSLAVDDPTGVTKSNVTIHVPWVEELENANKETLMLMKLPAQGMQVCGGVTAPPWDRRGTFKASKNALLLKGDFFDIEKPTEITNRQSKGKITVREDLRDRHI